MRENILEEKKKISDLERKQQKILYTIIDEMHKKNKCASKGQITLHRVTANICGQEKVDNFELADLQKNTSYCDRKVILKEICAYLFLEQYNFDFKENKKEYGWIYEITCAEDVEEICQILEECLKRGEEKRKMQQNLSQE